MPGDVAGEIADIQKEIARGEFSRASLLLGLQVEEQKAAVDKREEKEKGEAAAGAKTDIKKKKKESRKEGLLSLAVAISVVILAAAAAIAVTQFGGLQGLLNGVGKVNIPAGTSVEVASLVTKENRDTDNAKVNTTINNTSKSPKNANEAKDAELLAGQFSVVVHRKGKRLMTISTFEEALGSLVYNSGKSNDGITILKNERDAETNRSVVTVELDRRAGAVDKLKYKLGGGDIGEKAYKTLSRALTKKDMLKTFQIGAKLGKVGAYLSVFVDESMAKTLQHQVPILHYLSSLKFKQDGGESMGSFASPSEVELMLRDMIMMFSEFGADPNVVVGRRPSPLFIGVAKRQPDIVSFLLHNGARVPTRHESKHAGDGSILHAAAYVDNLHFAKLLYASFGEVEEYYKGIVAFLDEDIELKKKAEAAFTKLIKQRDGEKSFKSVDIFGLMNIESAIIVRLLLSTLTNSTTERVAEILLAKDPFGRTALHIASRVGNADTAQDLVHSRDKRVCICNTHLVC